MAKISFYLKDKNSTEPTPVNMYFSFGYYEIDYETKKKKYKPLKYSTGILIPPRFWNEDDQQAKETKKFSEYSEINSGLRNIKSTAFTVLRRLQNDNIIPNLKNLKEALDEELRPTYTKELDFMSFIEIFIHDSEKGKRLTDKGKKISPFTIKGYTTTQNHLKEYIKDRKKSIDFDSIDMKFYHDFIKYFHEKDYTTNTVGKNIKNVKVFIKEALKRGIIDKLPFNEKDFKVVSEDTDQIYLNEKELEAIYYADLSKNKKLENVRDLFIIACYTGLRYSDLSQLSERNIINDEYIKITTQKTGEQVYIPLHWMIKEILKKHEGKLPRIISNQKMNKYLKDLGDAADIKDNYNITKTKGGLRYEKSLLKYKLITVHTARRSFATNMYLADVPTLSIMKITGHKTEKAFLRYIRISQEDNAKKLLNHEYFKPKLKVST